MTRLGILDGLFTSECFHCIHMGSMTVCDILIGLPTLLIDGVSKRLYFSAMIHYAQVSVRFFTDQPLCLRLFEGKREERLRTSQTYY